MATKLLWRNANESTLQTLRGESPGQYDIRLGRSDPIADFFSDLDSTSDHKGLLIEITTERSPMPGVDGETMPWEIAVRRMGEESKRRDWYIRSQRPETAHPLWRPGIGPLAATVPGEDFVVLIRTGGDLFHAGWLRRVQLGSLPTALRERMESRDIDAVELNREAAASLGAILGQPRDAFDPIAGEKDDDPDEELEQGTAVAFEGRERTSQHVQRERSPRLRQMKIETVAGQPICEVCGFDFQARYGERGSGFIECHHLVPVSQLDPGVPTTLDDLALLCANCHRMVHATRPWLGLDELRELLTK